MTGEIVLSGVPYGLRCDMNVIEQLDEHYGGLSNMPSSLTVADVKYIAAVMMDEHNFDRGAPERYTPERVGALLLPSEYAAAKTAVMTCFVDSWGKKKEN